VRVSRQAHNAPIGVITLRGAYLFDTLRPSDPRPSEVTDTDPDTSPDRPGASMKFIANTLISALRPETSGLGGIPC